MYLKDPDCGNRVQSYVNVDSDKIYIKYLVRDI